MKYAKEVFLGNIDAKETIDTPLHRYNCAAPRFTIAPVYQVNLKIRRKFVWHNFYKGYIMIEYSCYRYGADGNSVGSSTNISSKWIIEKKDNKWEIVDIIEAP